MSDKVKAVVWDRIARAAASVGVCYLGALAMHISEGETGVGWALLGIYIVWFTVPDSYEE